MARYLAIVLAVLCLAAGARGQTQAPRDEEIARAIARGVIFLKAAQGDNGEWRYGEQPQHSLGMTALAGLALLENGIARDAREISKAREIVATQARESNQTYDLALAILFLARCQQTRTRQDDSLIQLLGRRLAHGDHGGIWDYSVPISEEEATPESPGSRRGGRGRAARINRNSGGAGDNSNTQFALLGLWAAGRHGFDSDETLESIDGHFRSSQLRDGRWGYRNNMQGSEAMSCAGLMGLAIAASRPSLAERQTARRGERHWLRIPHSRRPCAPWARTPGGPGSIRTSTISGRSSVCAWRLDCGRSMDLTGTPTAQRILLERQESDGGWPSDRWGRLPSTALALLFLRKANLAFEIDRVLRLPGRSIEVAAVATRTREPEPLGPSTEAQAASSTRPDDSGSTAGADQVKVIVTGASQQAFPRIAVQFEVKRSDGSFLLDAGRDDFRVTEEGRDVPVVEFQAPQNKEAIATTVVLVVDRSLSMEEEDRIGGLKTAVRSFLEKLPEGSKVALIAFGSDVDRLTDFTTDRASCSKLSMRSSRTARRGSTTRLRRGSSCSTANQAGGLYWRSRTARTRSARTQRSNP